MIQFKLIILSLAVLVFDKCNSVARHYHKHDEGVYDYNDPHDTDDYYPKYNMDKNTTDYPTYYEEPGYIPPPRNVSNGEEVVDADKAKYLVRLFSKCGESDFTQTVCMGVIIDRRTIITSAHCIYGQNFFQVCTRKPGETKCPSAYDPNDIDNCFETNEIYIHPDFVGGLLKGTLCHNLAVLKWKTDVFRPDQVKNIDFCSCTNDCNLKDKNATVIGCGNKVETNLTFFMNQIRGKNIGVDEYGDNYLQCPVLFTKPNDFQTETPCTGYAGAPLFVLDTPKNVSYNPNVDRLEYARLFGLGSFSGINCDVPTGFVALCDYKLFLSKPQEYGIPVANANKELKGFPLAQVIQLVQTLLLDGAYISCTLQRVVRTLSGVLGIVDGVVNLALGDLLLSIPI